MDNESLKTIQKLLEELVSRPDGVTTAALITVVGMVCVATLGAIVQWRVTHTVIKSEHERTKAQINSEFRHRQFEIWQDKFQEVIAQLLKVTDPEINPNMDRASFVPLIHKAQLMLNLNEQSHMKVNALINELGLAVNGWTQHHDRSEMLRLHGSLMEAARDTFYLPGKR